MKNELCTDCQSQPKTSHPLYGNDFCEDCIEGRDEQKLDYEESNGDRYHDHEPDLWDTHPEWMLIRKEEG